MTARASRQPKFLHHLCGQMGRHLIKTFGLVDGEERKMFLIEWLNEQMALLDKDRDDHKAKFDAKTICNEKLGSRREPKRGKEEEQKKVESDSFLPEYLCCKRRNLEDDKSKGKGVNSNKTAPCDEDSDSTERGDGKA